MLIAVALGALLAPLNSTMIAVAVPDIVDDFDTTVGTVGWLVTSYLLALAVVQPVAGKLGDRHGRRAFVLGGLAIFGVASLGAALAPSLAFLIVFRVLQAVSGAVVFPNGAGLIRELVPADRRGGAFGIVGGSIALAAGLGPLIGGVLVAAGGWRAIFLVNVPFVAAALAIAWRAVPRRPGVVATTAFDWLGAALLATVLIGSALLVIEGGHAPVILAPGIPLLLVLAVALIRWELRHPDPVFQPRFFAIRPFAAANAGISSSNLAFYTVLLAIPILLTRHLEWSSLQVGPRACAAVGPDGRVLADRRPPRRPLRPASAVGRRVRRPHGRPAAARARCGFEPVCPAALPRLDGRRRRPLDGRAADLGDRGARPVAGRRCGRASSRRLATSAASPARSPSPGYSTAVTALPASTPCF